jgi:hypothetical protein
MAETLGLDNEMTNPSPPSLSFKRELIGTLRL